MKLTPAQFRDVLGISQETLRHWRKVLPIFAGRSGYAPVFRPGDIVAGAVVKLLKDRWGISVSAFAEQSIALGRVCNETPWTTLATGSLVMSLDVKSCRLVSEQSPAPATELCLTIPLAPIIAEITRGLLQDQDDVQKPFYFPPAEVTSRRHKGGAR